MVNLPVVGLVEMAIGKSSGFNGVAVKTTELGLFILAASPAPLLETNASSVRWRESLGIEAVILRFVC